MDISLRLLDFNVYNEEVENETGSSSDDGVTFKRKFDKKEFVIQLFGLDEKGDDYSIYIEEFQPFFYVKVADNWSKSRKMVFLEHIKETIGGYYSKSITDCKIIKREELYGFDNHKEYKFIMFKFKNTMAYNKVKNLFYTEVYDPVEKRKVRKLNPNGYIFQDTHVRLYEANIPPLLRYFHIKDISPSGWITIPKKHLQKHHSKMTNCKHEYTVNHRHIISLKNKETKVPYKICSFDIEASSSHGDFPLAIKTYKKLVAEMLDYWDQNREELKEYTRIQQEKLIENIALTAFGFSDVLKSEFNLVYPKRKPTQAEQVKMMVRQILEKPVRDIKSKADTNTIAQILQQTHKEVSGGDDSDGENVKYNKKYPTFVRKNDTIIDLLNDVKMKREDKLNEITVIFDLVFPKLEGDKVTFIGSTFIKYGEEEPYLNHCIALDTCDDVPGAEIERYDTEKQVLLAWTKLIQRENPDIIIGYNIFGFDYKFMYERACENGYTCLQRFLKLSRNKDEVCGNEDKDGKIKIEETSLTIASGTHNLSFIKMNGRIQIDLYNYFRREYNLTSYKLDYVSGHFIGDKIKKYDHFVANNGKVHTQIISKNLTGLKNDSYIHIEEIGHSSEFYDGGAKFHIYDVDEDAGTFSVSREIRPDTNKILKWCLAKDDVSPHDIFRMTNEGPTERAVIAKYCIQDCNLVHHLLKKIDVITGMVEMANICSVPIDFIVMRGQGIKLFSFIAKKCREAKTLIPVLEKKDDGGYEGAIVLPPKCGLYLDEPVACVDYSSLYPSSMISENLSHDSKVWALEYDLDGNLISEVGVKDASGNYIYDNLPEYEYVDVEYDTYEYLRKSEKSAAVKTKVGHKKCRFAQFPNGDLAIMPRILKELLAARKATRASAKWKTITTSIGEYSGMVLEKNDTHITMKDKDGNIKIIEQQSVQNIRDTYDDFMKNVLDKRQLAIKVTANSLYGQCGAKTSSFYEKDVAASTTAIGRKLLTYGKRIIEEVYGDRICETQYGKVHSHAEYIYGDTDSVFMSFKLTDPETGEKIVGKEALKHTIELAKEAGELATKFLKPPHDLEYEKTFMPFCLLSKKRYVGMLYEEDPEVCYRKSMGIVLKRRDNAPIVKDVYGGIIDILMKDQNVSKAIQFTKGMLNDIVEEKFPLDKLIITKSLRAFYKNPLQIAHKVLADRIGKRDPGNKPGAGDRVPFVYIQTKGKVKLQGDKVEHPDYIIENKLKPDFTHYITNQIMKPVQQVFALVLQDIPEYKKKRMSLKIEERKILRKYKDDETKQQKYIQDYRNKEVKKLIFDDSLRKCEHSKNNQQSILSFFG
jgi:DNA polymerase elongation subunit (family B)